MHPPCQCRGSLYGEFLSRKAAFSFCSVNTSHLSCVYCSLCRRDKEGRSGGCYVLGYRVYVSGRPVASVDGAGSEPVLVDLPPVLAASCARVDVR